MPKNHIVIQKNQKLARKLALAFENDQDFIERYREDTHMAYKWFIRSLIGVDIDEGGKVSFSSDCRLVKNKFHEAWQFSSFQLLLLAKIIETILPSIESITGMNFKGTKDNTFNLDCVSYEYQESISWDLRWHQDLLGSPLTGSLIYFNHQNMQANLDFRLAAKPSEQYSLPTSEGMIVTFHNQLLEHAVTGLQKVNPTQTATRYLLALQYIPDYLNVSPMMLFTEQVSMFQSEKIDIADERISLYQISAIKIQSWYRKNSETKTKKTSTSLGFFIQSDSHESYGIIKSGPDRSLNAVCNYGK
jgi:hypothetical protein